jgi:uncharacterized damage-inducible protein DinB
MTPQLEHYFQFFESFHRQIQELIRDLPVEALNWRPLTGSDDHATNSLAVLVVHLTGAEQFWVGEVFGGRPAGRDREAEFRVAGLSAADLQRRLDETLNLIRDVLNTTPAENLVRTTTVQGRTVTGRWALLHALEHTALHLGHLQLTRQLWQARAADAG